MNMKIDFFVKMFAGGGEIMEWKMALTPVFH
jgi:hypothetical protein